MKSFGDSDDRSAHTPQQLGGHHLKPHTEEDRSSMTSIIKPPDEDLAEVVRLEFKAERIDEAEEAAWLRVLAYLLRTPPNNPVLDDPRTEDLDGVVLEEFGVITPYTPEDHGCKTRPVRLTHDFVGGLQIELGPYNLGERELRVLDRAIHLWLKSEIDSQRLHSTGNLPNRSSEPEGSEESDQ